MTVARINVPNAPVAIITGAGSGIGRATALELAADGWRIALVGRRMASLQETLAAAQSLGGTETQHSHLPIAIDIADAEAPAHIVNETFKRFGRIDALINNAAVLEVAPIHQTSDEALRRSFEVNAIAPTRLVRAVWPIMLQNAGSARGQVRGRIINISSMASIDPFPGLGVYGMSKSALEGLSRAINREGQADGIIAFTLILGAVETQMLRSFVSESVLPREGGRVMEAIEVAKVIADCAAGRGGRHAEFDKPIVLAR